jgi:hypothetical protein
VAKLGIITALWGDLEARQIMMREQAEEARKTGHDIVLLATGSEGAASKQVAKWAGWDYLEWENNPVSDKWNAVCRTMRDRHDPEGVVIMGSDDCMDAEGLLGIIEELEEGRSYTYFHEMYFLDVSDFSKILCHGRLVLGSGRMIARGILDQLGWNPWNRGHDSGLDILIDHRIRRFTTGVDFSIVKRGHMMGLKGLGNINSMDWIRGRTFWRHADSGELEAIFPRILDRLESLYLPYDLNSQPTDWLKSSARDESGDARKNPVRMEPERVHINVLKQ